MCLVLTRPSHEAVVLIDTVKGELVKAHVSYTSYPEEKGKNIELNRVQRNTSILNREIQMSGGLVETACKEPSWPVESQIARQGEELGENLVQKQI